MRTLPDLVTQATITDVVAAGWELRLGDLRYFPKGGGAYHWLARSDDASRWFVTLDDLDTKPWLGSDRDSVFDGLQGAYGTAMALRASGLTFVAAPIATVAGGAAERVDERHSVSVFAYVDGAAGEWGRTVGSEGRGQVVTMLARLHSAPPAVCSTARRKLDVPGRREFEEALDQLGRRWDAGPLSEHARHELAAHHEVILAWLAALDRLAVRLGDAGDDGAVVTHGEPHPGNLMRTSAGLVLVDWDTVAPARPERDLWMLVDGDGDDEAARAYRDQTGVALDHDALAAYRRLWALADMAAFTANLRAEHQRDADAEWALAGLRSILDGREPSPYGRPAA